MPDSIKDIAFGAAAVVTALWMSLLSWLARRELVRLDSKADRSEVDRLAEIMEKRDAEERQNRQRLYDKIDAATKEHNDITRELVGEVARLAGRLNGP